MSAVDCALNYSWCHCSMYREVKLCHSRFNLYEQLMVKCFFWHCTALSGWIYKLLLFNYPLYPLLWCGSLLFYICYFYKLVLFNISWANLQWHKDFHPTKEGYERVGEGNKLIDSEFSSITHKELKINNGKLKSLLFSYQLSHCSYKEIGLTDFTIKVNQIQANSIRFTGLSGHDGAVYMYIYLILFCFLMELFGNTTVGGTDVQIRHFGKKKKKTSKTRTRPYCALFFSLPVQISRCLLSGGVVRGEPTTRP